jgi:hypothetical protein
MSGDEGDLDALCALIHLILNGKPATYKAPDMPALFQRFRELPVFATIAYADRLRGPDLKRRLASALAEWLPNEPTELRRRHLSDDPAKRQLIANILGGDRVSSESARKVSDSWDAGHGGEYIRSENWAISALAEWAGMIAPALLADVAATAGPLDNVSEPNPRFGEALNFVRDLDGLLHVIRTRGLLLRPSWHQEILGALRKLQGPAEGAFLPKLQRFSAELLSGPEDLALSTIVGNLHLSDGAPALAEYWASRVRAHLADEAVSRATPASATLIRESAAVMVSATGLVRPGTDLRADGLPDLLFVELPTSPRPSYLSVYPVTAIQYLRSSEGIPLGGRTYPAVGMTVFSAERYLHWLSEVLAQERTISVRSADGCTETRDVHGSWQATLPSARDMWLAAGGAEAGIYPWSHSVDDRIAEARRLSGQSVLPVGVFADEVSRLGVFDLAGLIWHWTSDVWPDEASPHTEYRTVSGGGCGKNLRLFQTGVTLGAPAHTQRADRGFRVLLRAST